MSTEPFYALGERNFWFVQKLTMIVRHKYVAEVCFARMCFVGVWALSGADGDGRCFSAFEYFIDAIIVANVVYECVNTTYKGINARGTIILEVAWAVSLCDVLRLTKTPGCCNLYILAGMSAQDLLLWFPRLFSCGLEPLRFCACHDCGCQSVP